MAKIEEGGRELEYRWRTRHRGEKEERRKRNSGAGEARTSVTWKGVKIASG